MVPEGFKPFETLLKQSQSTKNWHSMGHMYGEYLDPLRLAQGQVNMMEIGLQFGASLNLWFSAFPRGKVYGLEYNRLQLKQAAGDQTQERATIFRGDQTNVTLLREISAQVRSEVGLLDFIVNDGGHSMEQQIVSFTHLMPLVRPGGVYFIEDLQVRASAAAAHLQELFIQAFSATLSFRKRKGKPMVANSTTLYYSFKGKNHSNALCRTPG